MAATRLLIDTNCVLDALLKRGLGKDDATKLLLLSRIGELACYISVSQFTDLIYILSNGKRSQVACAKSIVGELCQSVSVAPLDKSDIMDVLAGNWADPEDACIHEAAINVDAAAIITNNKSDFKQSIIPVYTPSEYFEMVKNTYNMVFEVDEEV